jgi:hypothetical protein
MASQPAPPGVQDVYQLMMRDQITPALHQLGFRGTRVFSYGRGSRAGYLRFQKDSRFVRRQLLHFTVNVGYGYGSDRIASLMPFPQTDTWWDVRGGQPTEQVAAAVVTAVRRYARPAILAGLEDPDPVRDPAEPDGGGADSAAWFVQPARTIHDEYFARLTADTPYARRRACVAIADGAMDDPRAVPALLDRLEQDPFPAIRKLIAQRALTRLARDPRVRAALEAAADDRAAEVRWAARFALRLDLPPRSA